MKLVSFAPLALVAACASSAGTPTGGGAAGDAGGKSGGSRDASSDGGLDSLWMVQQTSTKATGLALRGDGSYELIVMDQTSATAAEASVELGTFLKDATQIRFTPLQASCGGPHPAYVDNYILASGSLTLATSTGVLVFSVDSAAAATNVTLATGCFAGDGTFTVAAVAPVTP